MLRLAYLLFACSLFLGIVDVGCLTSSAFAARSGGKLTIRVIDKETNQPIAARMELRNSRGRAVRVRAKGLVSHGDYFVFDGQVTLDLRVGQYTFLIEAGPEYQTRPGHFKIDRRAEDSTEVVLQRRVDMQAEGWWAGDLDVRHGDKLLPLLMKATRVNLVPLFVREDVDGKCKTAKRTPNFQFAQTGAYLVGPAFALDYQRGGGLLLFEEDPNAASLKVCQEITDDATTTIALNPFAWDLPIWVAEGKLDAIQIIHRHALQDNAVDNEAGGRKRDKKFFPGKMGNGRWSEVIYHHLLNCGLRIPPAAGSGSGFNKNAIGTNRVYVQCGEDFSRESWFEGLKAGKVIVTNGPLLRTKVSGHPPGHQFQLERNETRSFKIGLNLAFYEKAPVDYLEIVKNGEVVLEIRLDELAKKQGRLPPLEFDTSGWFLVRAMTSTSKNYQYATTGPYYVESDYKPRVSRRSVKFFLDWLDDAEQEFAEDEVFLTKLQAARPFWEELMQNANAE